MRMINLTCKYFILNFTYHRSVGQAAAASGISHIATSNSTLLYSSLKPNGRHTVMHPKSPLLSKLSRMSRNCQLPTCQQRAIRLKWGVREDMEDHEAYGRRRRQCCDWRV